MRTASFAICLLFACRAAPAGTPLDRFLDAYPAESAGLESHLSVMKGIARLSNPKEIGRPTRRTSASFAFNRSLRKFEITSIPPSGSQVATSRDVYCLVNADFFHLRGEGDGPLHIEGIGSSLMDEALFNLVFGKYMTCPFMLSGSRLSELMKGDGFRIEAAKEVEVGGSRVIEVDFSVGPTGPRPSHFHARLDPSRDWAILRSEFRPYGSDRSESFDIEYSADPVDGRAFPRKILWKNFDGREQLCEFERIISSATPDDEFRLEYYGLKDVSQYVPNDRPRLYWWLIASGLVVLLFAGSVVSRKMADLRR